jgi:hypothetical protein
MTVIDTRDSTTDALGISVLLPLVGKPTHKRSIKLRTPDEVFAQAILKAIEQLPADASGKRLFSFKDIYMNACLNLGSSMSDALHGRAPCPKKCNTILDIKGRIRSWIEEHSPHSRQHYFRAGKRTSWKDGERPLLFVNEGLKRSNDAANWEPYRAVRGTKWEYNPTQAALSTMPSEEVLAAASLLYKKKGMRGTRHTCIGDI